MLFRSTNNGTFTAGTGIYTFITNPQALTGTLSIPNVTVNVITLTNNNTLTVGTALSGTGELLQAANATLNIGNGSAITTLTASADPNTVNYTRAAAQTVKGITYHNLGLSGSGNKTLAGGITVNGDLTVSGTANLIDAGNQIAGNAVGLFNLGAGTFLTLGNASVATTFPTGFTAPNITLNGTSTVNYNSNLPQTITAVASYGHLSLTSGAAVVKPAGNNLTVNGNLTIGANNTLNDAGFTISVAGNITSNGAHSGTGRIIATGGVLQNVSGTGSINNFEVAKSANNASLNSAFTINGDITVATGGLTLNNRNLITGGNISISGGASFFVTSSSVLSVSNGRTITNAGTFSFTGAAGTPATITRNGAGTFNIVQTAGTGSFGANYFAIEYGNMLISNGAVTSLNNGSFSNGTGFNEYLNLDGFAANISS